MAGVIGATPARTRASRKARRIAYYYRRQLVEPGFTLRSIPKSGHDSIKEVRGCYQAMVAPHTPTTLSAAIDLANGRRDPKIGSRNRPQADSRVRSLYVRWKTSPKRFGGLEIAPKAADACGQRLACIAFNRSYIYGTGTETKSEPVICA